jgi:hypothetical protein
MVGNFSALGRFSDKGRDEPAISGLAQGEVEPKSTALSSQSHVHALTDTGSLTVEDRTGGIAGWQRTMALVQTALSLPQAKRNALGIALKAEVSAPTTWILS